jgi:hypothetical protein
MRSVLTAVAMKSSVVWDITLCSPVEVNRRFGGTSRLHLQNRSNARNQHEAGSKQSCFSFLAYSSILKMDLISFSET